MKKTLVYKVIIVLVALMLAVGCVGNKSDENIEYIKDDVYGNSAFDTQYEVIEATEDEGIDVNRLLLKTLMIQGFVYRTQLNWNLLSPVL